MKINSDRTDDKQRRKRELVDSYYPTDPVSQRVLSSDPVG